MDFAAKVKDIRRYRTVAGIGRSLHRTYRTVLVIGRKAIPPLKGNPFFRMGGLRLSYNHMFYNGLHSIAVVSPF
jgi:hypothetical protein